MPGQARINGKQLVAVRRKISTIPAHTRLWSVQQAAKRVASKWVETTGTSKLDPSRRAQYTLLKEYTLNQESATEYVNA